MKTWQGILIFVTGAAAGAVGSLFYLRAEFKKKVDEEVAARDMAIRELKKERDSAAEEARQSSRRIDSKVSEELSKRLSYAGDDISVLAEKPRRTHSDASERHSSDREDVVYSIDENGEAHEYPSEGYAEKPYGISSEDFLLTRKEFDKTTLLYYEDDDTLSTEDGDIIKDIAYILGTDWGKEVGKYEDKIAYIRNEMAGTDYEVICESKRYTDEWAT